MDLSYTFGSSEKGEIEEHLLACNHEFIPALEEKVDIAAYSEKLATHAQRFEARERLLLVGLVALYHDVPAERFFVTNVSVLPGYQGGGIAVQLMENAIAAARDNKVKEITLEVGRENEKAISFYKKFGFKADRKTEESYFLILTI